MEFRPRNYSADHQSHTLPLSPPSSLPSPQVNDVHLENDDFFDPLRRNEDDAKTALPDADNLSEAADHQPTKDWTSFRRLLMQRFRVFKMVSISSASDELFTVCQMLIETAKSCLSAQDKYLQSTIQLVNKQSPTSEGATASTV